jgi:hypothetical protein
MDWLFLQFKWTHNLKMIPKEVGSDLAIHTSDSVEFPKQNNVPQQVTCYITSHLLGNKSLIRNKILFRNKAPPKKFNFSLGFQLNHFREMDDDSQDDLQSDDTRDAFQTLFEEVLHEILERIANATADSEISEQAPDQHETSHRPCFSLTNFLAERG